MLNGLAAQLFTHGRIRTTAAKAKAVRPVAEHLITFAKRGDVHARRQVLKSIPDRDVVHKLFSEIGPRYAERPGGYTRIVKLGPRRSDSTEMVFLELV
jgi:large subunit ribosomal protein L17